MSAVETNCCTMVIIVFSFLIIFYSLKTVVKRNCVQVNTHIPLESSPNGQLNLKLTEKNLPHDSQVKGKKI